MIVKDWLEDIKDRFEKYVCDYNLNGEDVEWLINRVEELEKRIKVYDFWYTVAYEQNQRYKQALEFYADEEIYKENLITKADYDADGVCVSNDEYAPPIIYFDRGEKARKALKGETK